MTSAKNFCQRGEMEEHVSRSPGFRHTGKCRKHSVQWHREPAKRGPSRARALQPSASPGHPPRAAPGPPGRCGRRCGVVWAAAAGQRVLLPETGPPQLQADGVELSAACTCCGKGQSVWIRWSCPQPSVPDWPCTYHPVSSCIQNHQPDRFSGGAVKVM